MSFVRQARFWLALLAEIILLATLHRFDDWRYAEHAGPVRRDRRSLRDRVFRRGLIFRPVALRPNGARGFSGAWPFSSAWSPFRSLPGDDIWRYQWEGKVQNAGFNPYVLAPNDDRLAAVREKFPDWSQINHRDFSAIYPPGTELVFAGLSRFGAGPLAYKLLFAAADLGAIALLLRLIGGRERYFDAAWYAWNPLVVYSFAGAAHFDSLMILPMLAGILCFVRSRAATGIERAMALGALRRGRDGSGDLDQVDPASSAAGLRFRARPPGLGARVSLGIPALLSLPFGVPQVPIWQSLGKFIYVARLNDMFWWLIEETFWPNPHQKNYQLQRRHHRRGGAGLAFLHSQLAARIALGDGHGAHPEPGPASLVYAPGFAAGGLAPDRCLAGALGHRFRLLPFLERAALPASLAFRAVAARIHSHSADRSDAFSLRRKMVVAGVAAAGRTHASDLDATNKRRSDARHCAKMHPDVRPESATQLQRRLSGLENRPGSAPRKRAALSSRGCVNPSFQACSIWREAPAFFP